MIIFVVKLKLKEMTKTEIITEVTKKTGLSKEDVANIIESLMETIKNSLANKENVYLRGFGSFIIKQRAKKTARNISKNITMIVPANSIPAFKPADVFMDAVK
jgi:DNA-binding protein HU-beta